MAEPEAAPASGGGACRIFPPVFDARKLDPDGLPWLDVDESFFNVRVAFDGEDGVHEAIVGASNREEAYRLFLHTEAFNRPCSYETLCRSAWLIWSLRCSREKALTIRHPLMGRVSLWKSDPRPEPEPVAGQVEMAFATGS